MQVIPLSVAVLIRSSRNIVPACGTSERMSGKAALMTARSGRVVERDALPTGAAQSDTPCPPRCDELEQRQRAQRRIPEAQRLERGDRAVTLRRFFERERE